MVRVYEIVLFIVVPHFLGFLYIKNTTEFLDSIVSPILSNHSIFLGKIIVQDSLIGQLSSIRILAIFKLIERW